MSRYELTLEAEFSAAHRLRMHDGALEPLHGHNWRVEVYLVGERLDSADLLADFTVVQARLKDVIGELHDTCLNDLPAFAGYNPSTESVARHICERFAPVLPAGVRVSKVRVWETRTCAAAYLPETGASTGGV